MVTDTSQYKFFKTSFDNVYKEKEEAGELSANPPDMLAGLEMPPHFTDPSENRFLPLDFQDFWILMDVNESLFFLNKYAETSFYYEGFCTPWFQRQPQVKNYEYFSPWGAHLYALYRGYELTYTASRMSPYYSTNYLVSHLCAGNDAPGKLGDINSENVVYIGSQSGSGFSSGEALIYSSLSDSTLCGTYTFKDTGHQGHDISSHYALQSPYLTEALSAWLAERPKTILQYGNKSSICNTPAEASASYVNFARGYEADYMAYFLNTDSPSCMTYSRRRGGHLSAWTDDKWGYAHIASNPGQFISWSTDRVPGSSPSVYRQYCSQMTQYGVPSEYPDGVNYKLMLQSPTYDFYGDTSVSVYVPFYVSFGGESGYYYYAKKFVLEMERSQYWFYPYRNVRRWVMQSKRQLSFDELNCLWPSYNYTAAQTVINGLRSQAGLSAWQFTDEDIPRSETGQYSHSCTVYRHQPFIVWKWNHPLVAPEGTVFSNQDEQA